MAKKNLKRGLALGALMAFVITGSAMAANSIGTVTVDGDTVAITPSGSFSVGEDGKDLLIESSGHGLVLKDDSSDAATIIGKNITIKSDVAGVILGNNYPSLNLGNAKTETITITSGDDSIRVIKGYATIQAKEINLTTTSGGCGALWLQNNSEDAIAPNNATKVTLDADTINLKGVTGAIYAYSNSQLDVNGNLTAEAEDAIHVRGNSTVNINTDGVHTTKLKGDIVFETPNAPGDSQSSGKIINAYVNINFNGEDSVWEGRSYQEYKVGGQYEKIVELTNDPYHGNLTGFKIAFNNGATWKVTDSSCVNEVAFGANTKLVINGADFTEKYAITTNKLTMDPTANLVINNSAPDTNYKVVKGENNISDSNLSYDRTALVAVEKTDGVYEVEFKSLANATDAELSAAQDKAITANGGSALVAPSIISGAMSPSASAESKALASAITQMSGTAEQKAAIINDIAQIGEKAGNTTNAVNIVNNVTGITNQRMSFTNINTAPQGGHGKVERKYKSGAGIWAQYMHGKDKVDDMPTAGGTNSYESQYNGAVIGYDFKEVGKTHTGISFNYGEGDSHSKKSITSTRNDFDFWGVGLYHSIMNDDTNLIFDINYNKSDADVKQIIAGHEVTANPNTTSFSFGVRAEKLIQNGPVQIVPYVGARFLTIDTDDYKSSADYWYAPERQDIWLIPVGVSLRQENTYENGWKVTPKADLSYIWALGDTDSSTTVSSGAGSNPFEYIVMDNGSFLGTLGIEAAKGDWTYGLSYSYQKGEYQRSDKWFVDVRYSF